MNHRDDFVSVDADGHIIQDSNHFDLSNAISSSTPIAGNLSIADGQTPALTPGSLDGTEPAGGDVFSVELTAGVTYSWAYRPTDTGGINDPFLALFNSDGSVVLAQDVVGGAGRSSMITFTPTTSGTYLLYATSFEFVDNGSQADTGNYTIDMWTADGPDAPGTTAGAFQISEGTTFGTITSGTDVDMYKVDLTAGLYYEFKYSGGVATSGEFGEPGGSVAQVDLLDSAGHVVASNLNFESGASLLAGETGTYYVRITPYQNTTGGYTLDVTSTDLSTLDPIQTLIWDNAGNIPTVDTNGDGVGDTAYVYFAVAGENFGEMQGDSNAPLESLGWSDYEKGQMMLALDQYEHIMGINFEITTDASQAAFRFITTQNEPYGGYMYPQDPAFGTQMGIGVFNKSSGGWGAFQQSLEQGGFAFEVMLHEIGHGLGFAHPHDTGGGSEIMPGVTAATGSFGVYNLNQGVYTVMSYNDGWQFHPDGPSAFTVAGIDNGWSTLGAFDIAALQERYGVHDYNTGDNVYALTDVVDDAFYQTIWDTGGNDTISYSGALDAQIDLTAATLDYSPTGSGVLSFLHNAVPLPSNSNRVRGGFTIAHDVVIENATGGSGNDVLIGNSANNVLTGNNGNDTLMGRAGDDHILGGAGVDKVYGGDGVDVVTLGSGDDIFVAELSATKAVLKTGTMGVDIITDFDASGNDVIDLTGLGHFNFHGTNASKNAGDLTYKVYDSVNGAEKALGFDIDGHPGASDVSGPVTVVYGNTDGGAPDFAVILLHTSSVDASDFIFA
jgi:serralysin